LETKIKIELPLDVVLEYLKLVGKTSQREREYFFHTKTGFTPKQFEGIYSSDDVFGYLYSTFQEALRDKFKEKSIFIVKEGYKIGDFIFLDKDVAENFDEYEIVNIVE